MPRIGRAWNALRWYVPPILLGVSPLVVVIGANLGTVPLRGIVIVRSLLAVAAAVFVVLWVLRLFQRDLAARATWLSWFLILFNLYAASAQGLRSLGLPIREYDPLFAVPYVLTSAVIAAIASRPWEVRAREPLPLTIAAALFLLVGMVPTADADRRTFHYWRLPADQLVASALSHPTKAGFVPARDIYYVVLDALGRADTLRRNYNLDLRPVVAALEARGFYVVHGARSNYSQTYLSLASTLNMGYLDTLVASFIPGTTNRDALGYLIQENALMRMASRAGYRVGAIGSDYVATQTFEHADVCICSLTGVDELEVAAVALTPLAAVTIELPVGDPYEAHRRKIIDSFDALEAFERGPGRTFLFAHVIAPHPPFVLARDGGRLPRRPLPYTLRDSQTFPGRREEYVHGYSEQTQYVLNRMLAVIDAVLRQPGPAPVIVIHGDHGPGAGIRFERVQERGISERMEIFAAYYFPDGDDGLYPTMTPVNGARLLARNYLGVELPLLADRVLFSSGARPYDLMPVPDPPPQDPVSPAKIR